MLCILNLKKIEILGNEFHLIRLQFNIKALKILVIFNPILAFDIYKILGFLLWKIQYQQLHIIIETRKCFVVATVSMVSAVFVVTIPGY